MQRTIKFRGKRRDNGEWAYGLPAYGSGGEIEKIFGWMGEDDNPLYDEVEVIPETIGQYTGWTDKEGKELYEGDVVQRWAHDDNTHQHEKATVWHEGGRKLDIKEIKFMAGSFVIWSDLIQEYRCFIHLARPGESLELLGNIHDNKELLTTK